MAATTEAFNLVNFCWALIGAYSAWEHIPPRAPIWLNAVALGGLGGAIL
jgi:hypothetical protein